MTTDAGSRVGTGIRGRSTPFRAWLGRLPAEVNADLRSSLRVLSPKSLARVIVAVVWVMTAPPLITTMTEHGFEALRQPVRLLGLTTCVAVFTLLLLPARHLRYLFVVLASAGPWLVFVYVLWTPSEAARIPPAVGGLTVIPLGAFMLWGRRLGILLTTISMVVAGLLGGMHLMSGDLTLTLLAVVANTGLMLGWAAYTAERLENDELTGLANRRALERMLARATAGKRSASTATFIAVLDVDGIRNLNEIHGRRVVDDLLHQVGTTLAGRLDDSAEAFHLGGGEFAALVTGTRRDVVEQLESLRQPPVAGVTMCAGLAAVEAGTTAARLLARAQTSLARAKAAGPNALDPFLEDEALVQELQYAVENGQLCVLYQPIVDLATGTTVGCEALVRWDHPVHGRITPDRFIPVAEQAGLIDDIGRFVLHEACTAASAALSAGRLLRYVSINASSLELQRPDFGDDVLNCLADTRLDPRRLILEVTESSVADEPEVAGTLGRLRQHGVRVAIDDFGTGYSSLSRLGELPVDILKIDKSFVWASATQARESVLTAIIGLATAFGLTAVAEGIETWNHAELLRDLGCASGQGYLFGKPSTFADLELTVADGERDRSAIGRAPNRWEQREGRGAWTSHDGRTHQT